MQGIANTNERTWQGGPDVGWDSGQRPRYWSGRAPRPREFEHAHDLMAVFVDLLPLPETQTLQSLPFLPSALSGALPIESEAKRPEDFKRALGLSMSLTAALDVAIG